jgi:hypothetical protein
LSFSVFVRPLPPFPFFPVRFCLGAVGYWSLCRRPALLRLLRLLWLGLGFQSGLSGRPSGRFIFFVYVVWSLGPLERLELS